MVTLEAIPVESRLALAMEGAHNVGAGSMRVARMSLALINICFQKVKHTSYASYNIYTLV